MALFLKIKQLLPFMLLGFMVFVTSGLVYYYLTQVNANKLTLKVNPASSFTDQNQALYNWDITTTQAHFEVLEPLPKEKALSLRFIFPLIYQDNIVKGGIECPLNDSFIIPTKNNSFSLELINQPETESSPGASLERINDFLNFDEKEKLAKRREAVVPLYFAAKKGEVFRGICGNRNCNQITGSCELYSLNEE